MEVWKDVKEYEGVYQVSDKGRVRSLDRYVNISNGKKRFCKGKFIKQVPDKDGYLRIGLWANQKSKNVIVHRLICQSFIPNPENKPQVNHKNGIKDDNRLENLEWATLSENRQHAYDTGLQNSKEVRGSKNYFAKLTKSQVLRIREEYRDCKKATHTSLSKKYNVSRSNITQIINRKTWDWI